MVAKRKTSRQKPQNSFSGQQILQASQVPVGSFVTHHGEQWRLTAINDHYAMLRDESQLDRLIFVSPDTLLEDVEPYQVRHLSDGKGAET